MKKDLTLKQTGFILAYLDNGGNKVQAALKVYNTTNYKSASKIADTNFHNPLIREQINQALIDSDISTNTIAKKIQEGLEAKLEIFDKNSNCYMETVLSGRFSFRIDISLFDQILNK